MTLRESSDTQSASRQSARRVPLDMIGVCLAALGSAVIYYAVSAAAVGFLVAVPLVLFLPGYVLVSILFPRAGAASAKPNERHTPAQSLSTARTLDRVTIPERLGLSFGLSIALVPLVGLLLEALPVEAFGGVIVPTLIGGILIGAVVGTARRLQIPSEERFQIPTAAITAAILAPLSGSMPRTERIATLALAVAVVLAVVSVGYAFAVPQSGEQYTDLRVLTESPDGELTFGNYPDEVEADDDTELVVGVDNHEQTTQTYTVVVTADQLIDDGDGVVPIESTEIDRFSVTLDDGERLEQPQTVTLDTAGEHRLNYYLYLDEPPETINSETAYRHVHFTVSVVDGEEPADGEPELDSSIDPDEATTEPVTTQPPAEAGDDS